MIFKAKLLFDECIGWPIVEQLSALIGVTSTDVLLGHAVKLGFGGQNDEDWIPAIAAQGWVIITGDRAHDRSREPERSCTPFAGGMASPTWH